MFQKLLDGGERALTDLAREQLRKAAAFLDAPPGRPVFGVELKEAAIRAHLVSRTLNRLARARGLQLATERAGYGLSAPLEQIYDEKRHGSSWTDSESDRYYECERTR